MIIGIMPQFNLIIKLLIKDIAIFLSYNILDNSNML